MRVSSSKTWLMLPLEITAIQLDDQTRDNLRVLLTTHGVATEKIDQIAAGKDTRIEVERAGSNALLQGLKQYELTVRTG